MASIANPNLSRRNELSNMYRNHMGARSRPSVDRMGPAPRPMPQQGAQRPQQPFNDVRERAAAAMAAGGMGSTSPGWPQPPSGGGMTSAVENTGGWQEAAPGARPQQAPMQQPPQTQPGGSWGFSGGYFPPPAQDPAGAMYRQQAPMQQAPQMTTTYAQPPQRQQNQAPPSAAQQKYNSYLGGGQQSQGATTAASPYAKPVPRFAYGTDNSQAYANAGMGNAWIPNSNNAHTAGSQLPPALQQMVNMGMPIPPALLASVTGKTNGPLNMASVFTARGGGSLPSLQGMDRMSMDERENFGGYLTGPIGMPEQSTLDSIARPTQNLQRAAASRMG